MKDFQKITILADAWNGRKAESIIFPKDWIIKESHNKGEKYPALSKDEIQKIISHPLGAKPIAEAVRGKEKVCIIFEDIYRATPLSKVVPIIINELHKAGIADKNIVFVAANGAHNPMSRIEFSKKLGKDIVERYSVYNHNAYQHHIAVGKTSLGISVELNKEVMSCDYKIAIGGIIPYWHQNVFSGGGKIIIPGIASLKTIQELHDCMRHASKKIKSEDGKQLTLDEVWSQMLEAASLAALDFKIDIIYTHKQEITGLFAGKISEEYAKARERAVETYKCDKLPRSDIVVVNSYPQEQQVAKSFWAVHESVKEGGDAIIIARHNEGIGHVHYLSGRFGEEYGGPFWNNDFKLKLSGAKRIFFYVRHVYKNDLNSMKPAAGVEVYFYNNWEKLLRHLMECRSADKKDNRKVSVAFYPYAALQSR